MKVRRILAMIGIVLLLAIACLPVFAAEREGTLYLHCATKHDGKQIVFSGDSYALVKIADAQIESLDGTDMICYTTLPQYQSYDCDWGSLDANQLQSKAKALASITTQQGPYTAVTTVDQHGMAVFSNLAPAFYLVIRTNTVEDHDQYAFEPFLVGVPMVWEGSISSSVTASPKYGWTWTDEQLPQTGQLNWPVPVLLLLGTALIVLGLKSYKHD